MTEEKTKCESCGKELPQDEDRIIVIAVSELMNGDTATRSVFWKMCHLCEDCEKRLVNTAIPEMLKQLNLGESK